MTIDALHDRLFAACRSIFSLNLNRAALRLSLLLTVFAVAATPVFAQIEFGSVALGDSVTSTVTVAIPVAGSLGEIDVLSGGTANLDFIDAGSTCVSGHAYAAGDTCTVQVTFAPKYAGLRYGMVSLGFNSAYSLSPNLITYLHGVGVGPQLANQNKNVIESYSNPISAAVDPSGDVFIAQGGYANGVAAGPGGQVIGAFTFAYEGNESAPANGAPAFDASLPVLMNASDPGSITVDGGGIVMPNADGPPVPWAIPTGHGYNYSIQFPLPAGGMPPGESGPPWFDGIGNTYVIQGGQLFTEMVQADGTISSTAYPLTGFAQPRILAVGLSGIVLVADTAIVTPTNDPTQALRSVDIQINAAPKSSALSFPNTTVGTSSGSQSETVTNAGTSTLTFSELTFPADFAQDDSAGNQCSVGLVLQPGRTCLISVLFKPEAGGLLNENVTVTIDIASQPGRRQSIPVSGIASVPAPVLSLASGSYTSAQSVAITDLASHAAVYFTVDGSVSSANSTLYEGPISITHSETVPRYRCIEWCGESGRNCDVYLPQQPSAGITFFGNVDLPSQHGSYCRDIAGLNPTHAPTGTVQTDAGQRCHLSRASVEWFWDMGLLLPISLSRVLGQARIRFLLSIAAMHRIPADLLLGFRCSSMLLR